MKLQVITTVAVISGFFTSTSADAGKFNLGKVVRTAQQINRTVNNVNYSGGQPKYKILPYPGPGNGGHPGHGGPVYRPAPLPHPGHGHKHCPPVNRPPVKYYTMKLINDTGAEVYYTLDNSADYHTMPIDDVDVIKSHSRRPHLISYHNGQEVVEYELNPSATYSFEWQGEILQLLEIKG